MTPPRPRPPLWRLYLVTLTVWNPLISVVIAWVFSDPEHWLRSFLGDLVIATVTASTCFFVVALLGVVEATVRRRRGLPPMRHSATFWVLVSLATMPAGVAAGFAALGWLRQLRGEPWNPPAWNDYRFGIFLGTVIAALTLLRDRVLDARAVAAAAELRAKEAENARLQAQLSALTAQLNPHLLFNALNTIAAFITSDPERAEATLLRLADLYRGVLDAARKSSHSLAAELALCRAYLDIEQARFGERLRVDFALDGVDAERVAVPVLLLQPLVENAVQHGISGRATGGTVRVSAAREPNGVALSVSDDGVGLGKSSRRGGAGVGMAGCKERLRLLYGERGRLDVSSPDSGGTIVTVHLPETT